MEFKNQKELFEYIWETREHISELSGKPLYHRNHDLWHWQFLHVLPKGHYKAYKLIFLTYQFLIIILTFAKFLKRFGLNILKLCNFCII